jgi:hypothetical protein
MNKGKIRRPSFGFETGLDNLPWLVARDPETNESATIMPLQWIDLPNTLRAISTEGYAAWQNKNKPQHVRELAHWAAIIANDIIAQLSKSKVGEPLQVGEETIEQAIQMGMLWQRYLLSDNERPASTGKRLINASGRKGRKAPAKSLRAFFNSHYKGQDWRRKTAGQLLIAAQGHFRDRDQSDILRRIRDLKKSGG